MAWSLPSAVRLLTAVHELAVTSCGMQGQSAHIPDCVCRPEHSTWSVISAHASLLRNVSRADNLVPHCTSQHTRECYVPQHFGPIRRQVGRLHAVGWGRQLDLLWSHSACALLWLGVHRPLLWCAPCCSAMRAAAPCVCVCVTCSCELVCRCVRRPAACLELVQAEHSVSAMADSGGGQACPTEVQAHAPARYMTRASCCTEAHGSCFPL